MAAEKTSRPVFFSGLEPVPASAVEASVDDFTTEQRRDGPSGAVGSSSRSGRNVTGEPLGLSHIELIEAHACLGPLWEYAEALETEIEETSTRGRPREHTVFEALLFEATAELRGNCRDIARTFADPKTWQRLRETVAQAWPRHPRRRLSNQPISRSQHHRFRERYLHGQTLKELRLIVEGIAVDAALHMDLLGGQAGSVNHPHTTQFAEGDGTWIPSIYKNGPRIIINPETGKARRFDPGAVPYHTPEGDIARGAYGRHAVLVGVRGPHRNERIILAADFKPEGKSDATVFCDMVLDLHARHPHLRKGLLGVTYDMALHAADIDRFLDAGIIPVSKVQRTNQGKPAAVNLDEHAFTTLKGKQVFKEVVALDGTPCILVTNDRGTGSYMPLQRVHTQLNRHINSTTVYATWQVPNHSLTPPELIGAATRIRHNSTTEERKHGKRRTRVLRLIPEGTDPDFQRIFGLRQDTESTNSHYKYLLPHGRARTATTTRQHLNLIAYRFNIMIKGLISHHQRTGTPLERWFGEHQPRVRAAPAKAA